MAISSRATQEWVEGSETRARSPDRTVKPHERAGAKVCCKCGLGKPLDDFDKSRGNYRSKCKRCRQDEANARYAESPDRRLTANKRWRVDNPEKKAASDASVYRRNRDTVLAQKRQYHKAKYETAIRPYKAEYLAKPEVIESRRAYNARYHVDYYAANKARYLAKYIARRELKAKAMPQWADRSAIDAIYEQARALTIATGVKHEVDHFVPLKGDEVCGLHVETNLRIMTRSDNRKKSNKLVQDIVRTAVESGRSVG